MALTMILLMLSSGSLPTWNPTVDVPGQMVQDFQELLRHIPDNLKPAPGWDMNCQWAYFLMMAAFKSPTYPESEIFEQAEKHYRDNCKDWPGGPGNVRGPYIRFYMAKRRGMPQARELIPEPLFHLPPLPDRAGGDLGVQIGTMFAILEARLAAGGHRLTVGRSCALASGALSAAEAVQRSPATATAGIGAGVTALTASVATYCKGQALAQKEAAWEWLRANRATQPLVAPTRAPTPAWPAPTAGDAALWTAAALLVFAPEALPILVSP